jgi:transposase
MTTIPDEQVHVLRMDARRIPPQALEELRRRAIAAVLSGRTQTEVANTFGLPRQTVAAWLRLFREGGDDCLRPQRRGRRAGDQLAISRSAQSTIANLIAHHTPDQFGLTDRLWGKASVSQLIEQALGISLGPATVRNYLNRWGMPSVPPVRRFVAADADGVTRDVFTVHLPVIRWSAGPHNPAPNAAAFIAVGNRGVTYFGLRSREPAGAEIRDWVGRLSAQASHPICLAAVGWAPAQRRRLASACAAADITLRFA